MSPKTILSIAIISLEKNCICISGSIQEQAGGRQSLAMEVLPLVYLTGMLCDRRVFQFQIAAVGSGIVIDFREASSIEEMIAEVEAVDLPEFNLIGFSIGGHVAQEFTIKNPERVRQLVLIASGSEDYPEPEQKLAASALKFLETHEFAGVTDKRLRDYLHPKSFANEQLRNLIKDMCPAHAKDVYLRQVQATMCWDNLMAPMSRLQTPTLFLPGADDQVVPLGSIKKSAENKPHSLFQPIEECGHFVPLEKPRAVNSAIHRFLNTTYPDQRPQ